MTSREDNLALFLRFRERGDVAALGALFDAVATDLFRLALYVASNPSDAEDLVQATFLTAIESAHSFDERRPLQPWLTGILTNHAHRRRRDRARVDRVELPDGLDVPVDDEAVDSAAWDEVREQFAAALRGLPQPYRQVVTLHLEEGMTARRIGEVLERPAGTVRSQVVRGLDMLRKALPAGFAGGAALALCSGHALAGVRVEVLRRAAELVPAPAPGASAPTAPGGRPLLSGPGVVAAVAAVALGVALAVGAWRGGGAPAPVTSPDAPPSATPSSATAADETARAPSAPDDGGASEPAADRAAASSSTRLRVRLVDSGAAPQQGLTCRCVAVGAELEIFPVCCARDDSPSARSDADGVVAFELAVPGTYECWLVGTNARRRFVLPDPALAGVVDWQVPPARAVRGRVSSPDGGAVAGVAVFASATAGTADVAVPVATTDVDGAFRFPLATSGAWVWAADDERRSAVVRIGAGAGVVELVARAAAGRCEVVVARPDGAPAAGAVVSLSRMGAAGEVHPPRFVCADASGAVRFDGLRAGAFVATARVVGADGLVAPRRRIEVAARGVGRLTLQLERCSELRGVVVDAGGRPAGGYRVFAQLPALVVGSFDGRLHDRLAVTGADGRYVLKGLGNGALRVRVVRPGADREAVSRSIELAPGARARLDFALDPRAVTGRLEGVAAPGDWSVTAAPVGPTGRVLPVYRLSQRVAADGSFSIDVPPRFRQVAVHAAPSACESPLTRHHARAVARVGGEAVALRVVGGGRAPDVVATLVDVRDRAAAAALLQPGRRIVGARADGGALTFTSVPAGDYTLRVQRPDGYVWTRPVAVPAQDAPVALGELQGRLEGLLLVAADGEVALDLHGAGGAFVRSLPAGAAVGVEAGDYLLRVRGPDAVPRAFPVQVQAGAPTSRRVAALDGTRCQLTFPFARAHNPLDVAAVVQVAIFDDADALVVRERLAGPVGGEYRWVQKLAPGRYRVEATAAWGGAAALELDVGRAPLQAFSAPLRLP